MKIPLLESSDFLSLSLDLSLSKLSLIQKLFTVIKWIVALFYIFDCDHSMKNIPAPDTTNLFGTPIPQLKKKAIE